MHYSHPLYRGLFAALFAAEITCYGMALQIVNHPHVLNLFTHQSNILSLLYFIVKFYFLLYVSDDRLVPSKHQIWFSGLINLWSCIATICLGQASVGYWAMIYNGEFDNEDDRLAQIIDHGVTFVIKLIDFLFLTGEVPKRRVLYSTVFTYFIIYILTTYYYGYFVELGYFPYDFLNPFKNDNANIVASILAMYVLMNVITFVVIHINSWELSSFPLMMR